MNSALSAAVWLMGYETISSMGARGRGGKRAGAGRPALYSEPLLRVTVTLPVSYIERFKREGAGNVSEGIRWLIENARTESGAFWYQQGKEEVSAAHCAGAALALRSPLSQARFTMDADPPPILPRATEAPLDMPRNPCVEIEVRHWEHVRWLAKNMHGCVFRGQRDAQWKLETSLERTARKSDLGPTAVRNIEQEIVRLFRRRAHQYRADEGTDELLTWVALIQHHGGPTRLLDFTHSFYVAAFFALEDAEDDAAIWAVERSVLHDWGFRAAIRALAPTQRPFTWLSPDMVSSVLSKPFPKPMVAVVEPERMNERLAAQQGLFLLPFDAGVPFMDNLFGTFDLPAEEFERRTCLVYAGEEMAIHGTVFKLVLKQGIRHDAMIDLRRMNITAASLFPGLDGFARSLNSLVW